MFEKRRLGQNQRIKHSPFILEDRGFEVKVSEDGQIDIAKRINDHEEDRVEKIPASLIFKVASMLKNTRRVVTLSDEEMKKFKKVEDK